MRWHDQAAFVLGLALLIAPAFADPVRFRSVAVEPTPLAERLAQQRGMHAQATPGEMITGELYRPSGDGRHPAVIALHGCAGRLDRLSERAISDRFTAHGYAVLWPDSYKARGIPHECTYVPEPVDRLLDVYGALDWLAAQPYVDPARIAVLGMADGGTMALAAVSPAGFAQGLSKRRFAASVAYYPFCHAGYAEVDVPTLILIGEQDDWMPANECRRMMARRVASTVPERLIVYPGAQHGFNLAGLAGHPVDAFRHHMEFAPAADGAAAQAVTEFLHDTLGR